MFGHSLLVSALQRTILGFTVKKQIPKCISVLLALFAMCSFLSGQGFKTILISGTDAFDGNGVFEHPSIAGSAFAKPVINEAGQIAFHGRLTNTTGGFLDNQGIYLYEPETEEVIQVVRAGEMAPGTVGNFLAFSGSSQDTTPYISFNDAGQIGVFASAFGNVNSPEMTGSGPHIFDKDGAVRLGALGSPDPRGLGVFKTFFYNGLANNGQLVTLARVEIDPNNIPVGLFISDPEDASLKNVVLLGDTLPDSAETFTAIDLRGSNNNGFAVFLADDSDGDDEQQDPQDIWVASVDSLERIADDGENAPGGDGVFQRMSFVDINDNNEVVFVARLEDMPDGQTIGLGLFLKDKDGLYRLGSNGVVAKGDDGIGVFGTPRINENSQVCFRAAFGSTAGIFLVSKAVGTVLVNQGDPVPGGGSLSLSSSVEFPQMWLNDEGQVLFRDRLSGVFDGTDSAAYRVDPDGTLHQVVRLGQALEGSTITDFDIVGAGSIQDAGIGYGNQRPMNNAGQVVFWAELEDGRDGIFLWDGPPPSMPDPEIDSVIVDGSDVVVSLDTEIGATYQLRRRDTLAAGDWQNEGNPSVGTGALLELRHPNALPLNKQFYDVLVNRPDG